MIELREVEKRFGDVVALSHLTLTLERAQTSVLLGLSGSGKSTVLRLIAGLLRPDRGTIRIEGEELVERTLPGLRRRLGYVIQAGGLFPHLSARENVELMARHLGHEREWRSARVAELCALTRLSESSLDRYPIELSGGQRQRVSLMRALMLDPPILLLDEPLGALDPITRSELQLELETIFRRLEKTVVLVTHDVREAERLGDRLVLLREGRIVQEGRFEALLEAPADPFVRRFIEAQLGPSVPAGPRT